MEISWAEKSQRKTVDYRTLEKRLFKLLQAWAPNGRWQTFLQVRQLIESEVGTWAAGWCWGEIDGGPVKRWCCFDHSFLKGKGEDEPALTLQAVLNGLRDWESVCLKIDSLFLDLELNEPLDLDIAVLEIVNFAVATTQASDAWYGFCQLVLSWFLQCHGLEEGKAQKLARKAVAGRFESWSAPSEQLKEEVAESFRQLVWKRLGGD